MNVFKPKNKCLARFYNWSSYYALAVIELGQAVAAAMPPRDVQASTTPSNTGCSASTQPSTSAMPICR